MKQISEKDLEKALVELSNSSRQKDWTPLETKVIRMAVTKNVTPQKLYEKWKYLTGCSRNYDAIRHRLRKARRDMEDEQS